MSNENSKKYTVQESYPTDNKRKICTFDEALSLCGTGKFQYILLFVVGLLIISSTTEGLIIAYYVMFVKCDLALSTYEQGILSSTSFVGLAIASHFWGFMSDTWGRIKVLRISMLGCTIAAILTAFANNIWLLIASRLLAGVFIAGNRTAAMSYLGEFLDDKIRAQAISFVSAFMPFTAILLPAAAIGILPLKFDWNLYGKPFASWRLYQIIFMLPNLFGLLAMIFMTESPRYLFVRGDHETALNVLRWMNRINNGRNKEFLVNSFADAIQKSDEGRVNSIQDILKLLWIQTAPIFFRKRLLQSINIIFIQFVFCFLTYGLVMWLPTIMNSIVKHMSSDMTVCEMILYENEKLPTNSTGLDTTGECFSHIDIFTYQAMMATAVVSVFACFLVGMIVKIIGKKRMLISLSLLSGIAGIALFWSRLAYLSIILFVLFLLVSDASVILQAITVDFYPTSFNAMAMCFVVLFGKFGSIAGTNVMGILLEYDCNLIFYGSGIIACALTLLAVFLPRDYPKNTVKIDDVA